MRLEDTIVRDEKLLFTLTSYVLALVVFINLSFLQSPPIGITVSIIYILINGIFLGHVFFENQEFFLKLTLGGLMLTMLLGLLGLLLLNVYNLEVAGFTTVLLIGATTSSLLNKVTRHKNE